MKRIAVFSGLVMGITVFSTIAHGEQPSGKQIVEASYEATRVVGMEAVMTLVISDEQGRERVRKVAQATKLYDDGETEKKLIRFIEPADVKGMGFLTFDHETGDDDKWLYMPALRKTRRIVSSENAKSFMGSEFSYADITRLNLDDFDFSDPVTEEVSGVTCYRIDMKPHNEDIEDENGFSLKVVWVGCNDSVMRKAEYYDLDGELLKELTILKVLEVDTENHRFKPTDMQMINKQNGRCSTFTTGKLLFNPDVKDEFFTSHYLERQ